MRRLRVLILEDRPRSTSSKPTRIAVDERCIIERVGAGAGAVGRAHDVLPDVVLVDVEKLPSAALDVARTIGWVHGVPLGLLSGLPAAAVNEALRDEPLLRFALARPLSVDRLLETVKEAFEATTVRITRGAD